MNRAEILQVLTQQVSPSRLEHCIRVEHIAQKLGPRFGVMPGLITPAALFHDLCREYDQELLLKLAVNFGIVIDDIEKAEPLLLHGLVGAVIIKNNFGITDPEILEAISFHITGGPGIGPLAQLIYIADFIEPGRTFPAARILREEAFLIDPNQLLLKVYNRTHHYLINHNYLIHPRGIAGRNELIMKGITEN